MFQGLSITSCEDITLRDLLTLRDAGHPVYRTSHAGNWSLYKLLLSQLGLPDCIWDVTCVHKDVNNQPKHQLKQGTKINLLGQNDPGIPTLGEKFLTPYQRPENNLQETLSSFHVQPLKQLFNGVVTTQSEALLEYKKELEIIFDIVERYHPEWFGRYVLCCGCMVEIKQTNSSRYAVCKHGRIEIKRNELRESAINTLEELKRLVLNPYGYTPRGGVIYSFELVVACYYLWSYWKFGDKTVYQLSGPDMIGYATKPDFIRRVSKVLMFLGDYAPVNLVPRYVEAKIIPATYLRFGYIEGDDVSKSVIEAHLKIVELQNLKRQNRGSPEICSVHDASIETTLPTIDQYGSSWNLFYNPAHDAFYSQHDMVANKNELRIAEGFLDIPFRTMGNILRTLPQIETSLRSKFLYQKKKTQ